MSLLGCGPSTPLRSTKACYPGRPNQYPRNRFVLVKKGPCLTFSSNGQAAFHWPQCEKVLDFPVLHY